MQIPLFAPIHKYVLDSSALFDLKKHYNPTIFKRLWEMFDQLCDSGVIISVKEVYREIHRGEDWLLEWSDKHKKMFMAPETIEECCIIDELQQAEPSWIDPNSDKPVADPFVIACAKTRGLIIIQHEQLNRNLPKHAKRLGVTCYRLQDFFEAENWEF